MVLDGQQRLQSLLLAFAGDNWGFKMEDRHWRADFANKQVRGRIPVKKHWSKGSLCFDVDEFLSEYKQNNEDVTQIDYRNVIRWAITDANEGQSTVKKPNNYVEPLDKAYEDPLSRRWVALNRVWRVAEPNENLKEKDFRKIVEGLSLIHI